MDTNTPRNGYGWIRRRLELLVSGCLLAAMLPLAIAQEPAGGVPYIPTVLITGANRGLGLEFTRQYVDRGWRVIATARRPEAADDLIALDEALEKLSERDKVKADLVKLRYFAGLTIEQSAEVLSISATTAKRYWAYARAWLVREID